MGLNSFALLLLFACMLVTGGLIARADLIPDILDCSLITTDAKRLVCYDQAVAKPPIKPKLGPTKDKVIVQFSGKGIQSTRPFTVRGRWEIQWAAKGMYFSLGLHTAKGKLVDTVANQLDSGTGSSYQPKGGKYYFKINAAHLWTIRVVSIP